MEDFIQEFNIVSYIKDILKYWWIIIISACLIGMGFDVYKTFTYDPAYTTSATFLVSTKSSVGNNQTFYNFSKSKQMAETLSYIISSNVMEDNVSKTLGIKEFPGKIEATVIENTNILSIKVTADSPLMAFKIIDTVINNYDEVVSYTVENVIMEPLESPHVPLAPVNILSTKANLIRGAEIGLLGMFLLVAVVVYLKDTVKTPGEVEKKLDTSLYGTLYEERKSRFIFRRMFKNKKSILISDTNVSFDYTEGIKSIRVKLEYSMKKYNHKVFLITSTLENEGKSTIAANIAVSFARAKKRVLLIDADMKRPALHKIFNQPVSKVKSLNRLISNQTDLENCLIYNENTGVYLLLGKESYDDSDKFIESPIMSSVIETAKMYFDCIIIDSPPVTVSTDATAIASFADISLLVVRQNFAKSKNINDVIDELSNENAILEGCIFNRAIKNPFEKFSGHGHGYGYKYGYSYGYGDVKK